MPLDAIDPAAAMAGTVVLLRDGAAGLEVLMLERPDRGSFAGAWVFPGGKVDADDRVGPTDSEEDVARSAGVRETHEEVGLGVDSADLVTLSVWNPPAGLPLRIRTWFFLAPAPAQPEPAPEGGGNQACADQQIAQLRPGKDHHGQVGTGAAQNATHFTGSTALGAGGTFHIKGRQTPQEDQPVQKGKA